MNIIATINGIRVRSDKKGGISVTNDRVTFQDGSWCDVKTGEVVNKGVGTISIGDDRTGTVAGPQEGGHPYRQPGTQEDDGRIVRGPTSHQATSVRVEALSAFLEIEPSSSPKMEITVSGPREDVEDIKVEVQGTTLVITQKEGGSSVGRMSASNIVVNRGSVSMSSIGSITGGSINISGGNISITGGASGKHSGLKVLLRVPKGSPLALDNIRGGAQIGDIEGALRIAALGDEDLTIGRILSGDLTLMGGADMRIAEVTNGPLSASIMGSGDIKVAAGVVDTLQVRVMGSGNFRFRGEAENASLTIMGSGDIRVSAVKNPPTKQVMGQGKIKIG